MSVEVWILVATAVLAVVAIGAAVVAVRAVRRMPRPAPTSAQTVPTPVSPPRDVVVRETVVHDDVTALCGLDG